MIGDLLLCVRGNGSGRINEEQVYIEVKSFSYPEDSDYVKVKGDTGGWTRDRFINLNKILSVEDVKMVKKYLKGKE